MTGRYRFSVDDSKPTLVSSAAENVIWTHASMDNSANLSDTLNESYETAEEDNATQYLSVLDASNMSLDQLNITLTNPKIEIDESSEPDETFLQQQLEQQDDDEEKMVVYAVEGSDELYGIQLARDEEGNLQKYQFQLRQNDEGQLEAMPETIQLLPLMEDEMGDSQQQQQLQIFVQDEHQQEELMYEEDNNEEQQAEEDDERKMEHIDIKPIIKQEPEDTSSSVTIITTTANSIAADAIHTTKMEHFEQEDSQDYVQEASTEDLIQQDDEDDENDKHVSAESNDDEEEHFTNGQPNLQSESDLEEYQIVDGVHITANDLVGSNELSTALETLQQTNAEIGGNNSMNILRQALKSRDAERMKKPVDDKMYFYVVQQQQQEEEEQSNEKENVEIENVAITTAAATTPTTSSIATEGSAAYKSIVKTNPRSILKNSHVATMLQHQNYHHHQPQQLIYNQSLKNVTSPIGTVGKIVVEHTGGGSGVFFDELLTKRFARGKEAMIARNFHNFIQKTTIPQAPIRKDRLPRKQKINPVQRMDEEIVVQEVMVSSNGFQEIAKGGGGVNNKENVAVMEYVELSDTDDDDEDYDDDDPDFGKKKRTKKRRGRRRKSKVEVSEDDEDGSDGSDEHDSVIELDESDEDYVDKSERKKSAAAKKKDTGGAQGISSEDSGSASTPSSSSIKRGRGRPPKNNKLAASNAKNNNDNNDDEEEEEDGKLESPLKKMRLDEEQMTTTNNKPEYPCTKCDKTFPSQNSLKTHLQHHNLQTSWNSTTATTTTTIESKYKCTKCGANFKNSILLKRHVCAPTKSTVGAARNYICSICKRKFNDLTNLNLHKRTHAKEQLVKSTMVVPVSPRKATRMSTMSAAVPSSSKRNISTNKSDVVFKKPTLQKTTTSSLSIHKCNVCGRICSSIELLNNHMKIHKEFVCGTCSKSFMSRLMFETHVREQCVKKSPSKTNSMRVVRRSTRFKSDSAILDVSSSSSASSSSSKSSSTSSNKKRIDMGSVVKSATKLDVEAKCDDCGKVFPSFRTMFKHRVAVHKVHTPDTQLLKRDSKVALGKTKHGGIPASKQLRSTFVSLNLNMEKDQQQNV